MMVYTTPYEKHMGRLTKLLRISNPTPLIWLLIILLIGSFLRLYRFADFMKIDSDHGRDILIAKHIVEYGEGYWAAPYALGSNGLVKNSPVYYWILASMWFISRSTVGMGIVFALTGVITIIIGYGAGLVYGGVRMGLTFAFFLSISALLVQDAHGVWPPFLLPLVTVITLYCMARFIHEHRIRWLALCITAVFLGVHVHQSFLPFFGVCTLWVIWSSTRVSKKAFIILCSYILLHIVFWAYVTGNGTSALQEYLRLVSTNNGSTLIMSAAIHRAGQAISLLFPHVHGAIPYAYAIMTGAALILLYQRRTSNEKFVGIVTLCIGMLAYGLYGNNGSVLLRDYYFHAAAVVFLFILSFCLIYLLRNKRVMFGFISITGALLNLGNEQYIQPARGGNYLDYLEITRWAINDYKSLPVNPETSIVFYTRSMSAPDESGRYIWSAAPQWYLFEDIEKKPAVTIPDGYNNFAPPVIDPDTIIYLTCIGKQIAPHNYDEAFRTRCVDPFVKAYGGEFHTHRNTRVFTLHADNTFVYRTYRYTPENYE